MEEAKLEEYRNPFSEKVDPDDNVVKEEIIESFGTKVNFESKNDMISTAEDVDNENISTDEINARKAFLYFNDCDAEKRGDETFQRKVERIQNELSKLKVLANRRETSLKDETEEEPKEESKSTEEPKNVLKQIESLENQVHNIVNPQLLSLNSQSNSAKPLESILSSISAPEKPEENVVYELMYNSDCKNLMIAAKISELKKRINVIQKCISGYNANSNSKFKSISHMLSFTQDQIKFMSEKEAHKIIISAQQSRESENVKFNTEVVNELTEIVADDKDESDHLEQDIKKLESLKHVHEQSAEVFNKISDLQEIQTNILASLAQDQGALKEIQGGLKENLKVIKENMKNIKERIAKVKS